MSGGAAAPTLGRSLLVLRGLARGGGAREAPARAEAVAALWSAPSSSSSDRGSASLRPSDDDRGIAATARLRGCSPLRLLGNGMPPPPPRGLATAASLFFFSQQQQQHPNPFLRSLGGAGGVGGGSRGLTTTASTAPRKNDESGSGTASTAPHPPDPNSSSLADVQGLLDSLSALRLREELNAASDATPYVTHARLLEIVREAGAADTAAEAERLSDALVRAGVVLRLGGVVYLRPQEVAEMVLAAVPSDGAAAAQRLAEVERELEALDRAHAEIVAQARRWPRVWLGAGCAAFAAQLAGFVYLCYWELSWDVVEPLACFVSMGWTLVAWLYFLARGSALDYGAFDSHWTEAGLEKRMAARGFDPERHERLAMARDRYRRYLSAQRAAALAEGVPSGGVVSSSPRPSSSSSPSPSSPS